MKNPVHQKINRIPFVTSSGEISNFLIEDLERVLQLEHLDFEILEPEFL